MRDFHPESNPGVNTHYEAIRLKRAPRGIDPVVLNSQLPINYNSPYPNLGTNESGLANISTREDGGQQKSTSPKRRQLSITEPPPKRQRTRLAPKGKHKFREVKAALWILIEAKKAFNEMHKRRLARWGFKVPSNQEFSNTELRY